MPFCPDLGRQSTLQPSWKGPVKSVIITGAVFFSCIDRSDGCQAHDQKVLKPYIRMHLLTWLKMNITQFLLCKFVKIRRKSFIIVSWPGEDCQSDKAVMEHRSEGHQGGNHMGISGGYSSAGSQGGYMLGVVNSNMGLVFAWSGRRMRGMRDVSYRFLFKKKIIVCTVHHVHLCSPTRNRICAPWSGSADS